MKMDLHIFANWYIEGTWLLNFDYSLASIIFPNTESGPKLSVKWVVTYLYENILVNITENVIKTLFYQISSMCEHEV